MNIGSASLPASTHCVELHTPYQLRVVPRTPVFSQTMKFRPASAAVAAATMPALPAPMMSRSVSRVLAMSDEAISGAVPSQSMSFIGSTPQVGGSWVCA